MPTSNEALRFDPTPLDDEVEPVGVDAGAVEEEAELEVDIVVEVDNR